MRVMIAITVWENEIGRDRFDQLKSAFPEGVDRGRIDLRMPEIDARTLQFLAALSVVGIRPWHDQTRARDRANEVWIGRYREYDEADFESAEFLQVCPRDIVLMEWPRPGVEGLQHRELKKFSDFAAGLYGSPILVTDRVRRALESATLQGLVFEPLTLFHNARGDDEPSAELDWSSAGGPRWKLEATIALPPPAPPIQRVNPNTGAIFPRESTDGMLREPGFDDVQLCFYRGELTRLPKFDVAGVKGRGRGSTHIVVSKRFYEHTKAQGFRCWWKPVRIEEG